MSCINQKVLENPWHCDFSEGNSLIYMFNGLSPSTYHFLGAESYKDEKDMAPASREITV